MNTLPCHECNTQRPSGEFITDRDGYAIRCRTCEGERKAAQFERLCPPLYRHSDATRLPLLAKVLEWKRTEDRPGLLLRGSTGRGKSRCAWLLVERIMTVDLQQVYAFDCVAFGHDLSRHYRDEDNPAEMWLDMLAKAPVVFFDDLGKLKITERAEAELFGLIERRTANQLPIIATTNDSGDSLSSRMTDNRGPALIRRLREFCQVIDF